MLKSTTVASALLALTLLTAGCSGVKAGLGKEKLAKNADKICAEANPKIKALGQPDTSNLRASQEYFTKRYQISLGMRTKLRDLNPDDKARPQWERTLDLLDKTHNGYGRFISAAKNEDKSTSRAIAKKLRKDTEASNRAWEDFGASGCAGQST